MVADDLDVLLCEGQMDTFSYQIILRAVPQDKLILLDYYCDHTEIWKKTEGYYGQPYIWCYLGNFGGNTMLAGNLDDTDKKFIRYWPKVDRTYTVWVSHSKLLM